MKECFKNDICKDFRRKKFIKLKEEIKPIIFNKITHAKLSLSNSTEFFNEIKQQLLNNKLKLNYEIKIEKVKSNTIDIEFIGILKIKETNLNIIKSAKGKEYKTKSEQIKNAKCAMTTHNFNDYLDCAKPNTKTFFFELVAIFTNYFIGPFEE